MIVDPVSVMPDGLSIVDWILRLSNVIGLGVLMSVARKIGAFEQFVAQLKETQTSIQSSAASLSVEVKEISRVVYQTLGQIRGGGPSAGNGSFPL